MTSQFRGRFVSAVVRPSNGQRTTLFEGVQATLGRLAPHGWATLFADHGLDITAQDLAHALRAPLPGINRRAPGFEDFALEGVRGIEPGIPAQSLVYHALASPSVMTTAAGQKLAAFPTLAEIETIENYVYGVEPPCIEDLRVRADGARLAIVVFALEYRCAAGTVHQRHADLVLSRTGVARVGTGDPLYLGQARGYLPFVDGSNTQIRVLPCRYAAFVAALVCGSKGTHGPLRFLDPGNTQAATSGRVRQDAGLGLASAMAAGVDSGDGKRLFWIPMHKLFSGSDCLLDRSIEVRLAASHTNEKIRRAHLKFLAGGHNGGWSEPDVSQAPFVFHDGIAEFSTAPEDGSWLLVPQPHDHLVAPASYNGAPLTYAVPSLKDPNAPWGPYQSTLNLKAQPSGARAAPEYLHARWMVEPNGTETDLNSRPDLLAVVKAGGYRARHFVDFTGDGWIDVECSELALDLPRRLPAYSLVSTPHFFPFVDQTALMQWTDQSVLPSLLQTLWDAPETNEPQLPQALSDQRIAANLQLTGANFDPDDDTMTAIVGPFGSGRADVTRLLPLNLGRASSLPDGAAGIFAPGWDVSFDRTQESDPGTGILDPGVTFLANYGLGSPFPEDTKLCAALAAFWPAAAPDITRTFSPSRSYATATPLIDEVIGLGSSPPWDGVKGPTLDEAGGYAEYASLAYADYVQTALGSGFDISVIGRTTAAEYIARTLTMALVYTALGVKNHSDKLKYSVLSFRKADPTEAELVAAQDATGRRLDPKFAYRYQVFDHADRGQADPTDFKKIRVKFGTLTVLFADPTLVLMQDDTGGWSAHEVRR
ncbi:hypothetical protein [Paraburkholderia sp. BL17N1]|uniref:hypothetical protein n=1 Tax=Paraburkholderia sp. BL17N1 TaxID=1938798 RepID=UPI000F15268D|nr:hypothetical protein [Paraburkholderia sp. BL17N1]RKR43222.1 hypothetical protein B0G82_0776 [Paraburkholderia sp. BL17N1]